MHHFNNEQAIFVEIFGPAGKSMTKIKFHFSNAALDTANRYSPPTQDRTL
jgi:hypothetical protein